MRKLPVQEDVGSCDLDRKSLKDGPFPFSVIFQVAMSVSPGADGCVGCEVQVWLLDMGVIFLDRPRKELGLDLCFPGCVTLSGPGTVRGTEGGSLSLQCRYEEKFKNNDKYWCKGPRRISCETLVKTSASEGEEKDRVSIRDCPEQLYFMVTMWGLTAEDEDVYWCAIDIKWWDRGLLPLPILFPVNVSVSRVGLPVCAAPWTGSQEDSNQSQHPRSLLNSVHIRLLVFLKVPLLLSMLGAVLWVNRPQRLPRGPPDEQRLYKDDQLLEDARTPGECGFTSQTARPQAPATVGLAFRSDDTFEALCIEPFSSPPELPDAIKPQDSGKQCQ
ncbi:PREDICTED: CMRF35-like molecule-like [Elephantulus edwardii]|uniref:CMRF35-like molecule-like n=1 Tax=Elephantulus edwardii TaxID=28737 RepID=UPI0003F09127|nr:PREDICTED: CMRF35-like molecule-like [Elephantulus edwardii]